MKFRIELFEVTPGDFALKPLPGSASSVIDEEHETAELAGLSASYRCKVEQSARRRFKQSAKNARVVYLLTEVK